MPSVANKPCTLRAVMLNVDMLSVVMLYVVTLSVVAPFFFFVVVFIHSTKNRLECLAAPEHLATQARITIKNLT